MLVKFYMHVYIGWAIQAHRTLLYLFENGQSAVEEVKDIFLKVSMMVIVPVEHASMRV